MNNMNEKFREPATKDKKASGISLNIKEKKLTDKRKNVPIVEVQHALSDWYDLRLNEIMHVVEGRIKGDPDFIVLNENNIYIKLLSSGYHISIANLGALLNSDFVPSYNPFKEYLNSLPPWNENDYDYIEELANHI